MARVFHAGYLHQVLQQADTEARRRQIRAGLRPSSASQPAEAK